MRPLICICCLFSLSSACLGQDSRFVEFRDGSVMRLPVVDEPWQITVIRSNGQLQQKATPLGQIDNLIFTREKGFAKKQAMLAAVRRLGADDFQERERAQDELLKLGVDVRADLENCLSFTNDTEARLRLQGILKMLPEGSTARSNSAVFDRFKLDEECWGHLGDSGVPVQIDGKTYRLPRDQVMKVSRTPPPYLWIKDVRPSAAPFERIAVGDFPVGCVEESFERTPAGKPVEIGSNIERLFIDKGFVLSTSISTSYVSANNFKVEGKSGGLSVATHQPIWEGAISVRFVEPGREQAPAGVHYFGCWIAAVVPNGTNLVAFDRGGNEIGRIATQTHGNDFLGVRSATPMFRIQIVPNPQFDRDFTLDDFIYSPPQNPESRHTDKFIVHIKNGSRFLCNDVAFEPDGVHLFGLPGELPDWTLAHTDVERIALPGATGDTPQSIFAELRDGSVIAGKLEAKQPKFARVPKVLDDEKQLRAVWGSGGARRLSAATDKTQIWKNEQNRWQDITDVRFLEEIVIWKENGEFQSAPYHRLPMLRFAGEADVAGTNWRAVTEDGDELVLQSAAQLRGRLSQGLSATWQGRSLQLMRSELRFLVRSR